MSRVSDSCRAERTHPRTWGDSALKIDPEFEHELRHVLYDRDVSCPRCRYNLSGIEEGRCPECGMRLGEYLRLADTAPWRLESARRCAQAKWVWSWVFKGIVGVALGVAMVELARTLT